MKMENIISFIKENWGAIIGICGVFGIGVEVAPVKLYPVSWLLKKAGNIMNYDIAEKVNALETEFQSFKKDDDMERINNIRKEIVDFSLACQKEEHHTRDEYDRIFDRVGAYHELLKKYGMENGKIDIEVNYIKKVYSDCLV